MQRNSSRNFIVHILSVNKKKMFNRWGQNSEFANWNQVSNYLLNLLFCLQRREQRGVQDSRAREPSIVDSRRLL